MAIADEAKKWTLDRWKSNVKHIAPSPGGAVGVLFVWTKTTGSPYTDVATADFVIKPVAGGVSTTFAEEILSKVADTNSPNSRLITNNKDVTKKSGGAKGILHWVNLLAGTNPPAATCSGSLDASRAASYRNADNFLLQDAMSGYTEMSDVYKSGGTDLRNLIRDQTFMYNLGKMSAADLILGNGDRVANGNFGNIMFNSTGELAAIDSSSILASFNQLMKADTGASQGSVPSMTHIENDSTKTYVSMMFDKSPSGLGTAAPSDTQIEAFGKRFGGDASIPAPVLAPTCGLDAVQQGQHGLLFDSFKSFLEQKIAQYQANPTPNTLPLLPPRPQDWVTAKAQFVRGFDDGLTRVDTVLGGSPRFHHGFHASPEWKNLKRKYKNDGYSGGDPNMSWYNFAVRREVYMALRSGCNMDEAIRIGYEFALKKKKKNGGIMGKIRSRIF